tara:strand:- start:2092 stop:2265 length:174 start_codon:yes stop_codon:yes gene_type:complete
LQEKLLGKWRLTKDEGFEFFINSPMAQNMPDDEMEKFYELMEKLMINRTKTSTAKIQ